MTTRALRVLHVVGELSLGGVAMWLVDVLRRIDRDRFQLDVLVLGENKGDFDDAFRSLGANLYSSSNTLGMRPARTQVLPLLGVLRRHGPYDMVHCHLLHLSGLVSLIARIAGVPARIAHSHATGVAHPGVSRRLYERSCRALVHWNATLGLAASEDAACSMFGAGWKADARWRVLLCGIDLDPFRRPLRAEQLLDSLAIPPRAFLVGHVGRFSWQKNHDQLVDIFRCIHARRADAKLLLVGDGPLRPATERKVKALGLGDSVVFAGLRNDVPDLLRLMDAFILPSIREGLPLVSVEAQAAGTPVVLANHLPWEGDVVVDRITRVPLEAAPEDWAAACLALADRRVDEQSRRRATAIVSGSPFNITESVRSLERAYLEASAASGRQRTTLSRGVREPRRQRRPGRRR